MKVPAALELALFCHQTSLVLKSGLNLLEGIPLIAEEMSDPRWKASMLKVSKSVLGGLPLHKALEETGLFPAYLITMVRIGETTGMLESILDQLSLYYEKEDQMAKRIRGAIAYPVLLLVLMIGVILLLVTQVLPMFAGILASLGSELPAATRLMLAAAEFVTMIGPAALLVIVAIAAVLTLYTVTRENAVLHCVNPDVLARLLA